MKATEIKERKKATLIVLLKILDNKIEEEQEPSENPVVDGIYKLKNNIALGNKIYTIDKKLLRKIMVGFGFEGIIAILQCVNEEYVYLIRDIEKIRQKIENLTASGVFIGFSGDVMKKVRGEKKEEEIKKVSFDLDTGMLTFGNKKINFRKTSKQYSFLKIIFKNKDELSKDRQLSEIAEDMDAMDDFKWKRLYDMAKEIKRKIAAKTGLEDVFIITTQSIQINQKYL